MKDHHTYENGLKYKPDYKWPEPGSERNCPKFDHNLELAEDVPNYFGKPWWCHKCQYQFSEEEFPDMKCPLKDDSDQS